MMEVEVCLHACTELVAWQGVVATTRFAIRWSRWLLLPLPASSSRLLSRRT